MLNALGKLNDTFVKEYGFTLNIGIGLHTGRVRVGNMGTKDLFNYTIIGDNVNVASRLENLSKFYGVRIIFSEDMKTYVPRTHQIQELDLVRIRGRQEPLKIYGLFTGKFMADSDKHIAAYYHALRLYREQKFGRALEIFEQFRQKRVDRRLYKIYRQRCKYYLTHPPGKSWDGIFTHQQK
ncbi:adenylate/guanylate cyclase domain-containing protein [uncultured Desulfobacter sp.]|uniref:adenylate/guanylate cyclase domain-containing protein n=1 Tax=uncultured Desulfobacter sp. TaxID=240139 RepID=UPI0029F546AE|nr:adenylate/guanylate cyclase domain-containing protein [uncultured Desulfobacter sp.]